MISNLNPLLVILSTCALLSIYLSIRATRHRGVRNLPPGPKGIPFFGNLFQLSTTPWKEFENWKEKYGPLIYIKAAGQGILILNNKQVAADLLDRRGSIYADRPQFTVASEMLFGGMFMILMNHNERFRRMRRAGHEALSKAKVTEYNPIQTREAVILADEIMHNPSDWANQLSRRSASMILSVSYDRPEITSNDDPLLLNIYNFLDTAMKAASPMALLVDFFPWMRYAPSCIAGWKRNAVEGHQKFSRMFGDMFHEVEHRINEGDERPSIVGNLIRERQRHHFSDLEAAWFVGAIFAAGFETTSTSFRWFMLAMITYPDKQKKCQEELDAVVGRARMPTFKDKDNLPYIQATVRELLRWRAVVPLSAPHYTKQDDWYQGYFIPKGTICLPNIWSMNRDQTIYGHDADDFNPDRFLGDSDGLAPAMADTKDEGHVTFGFGPRICLGRNMASDTLFIQIASILWAASIAPGEYKDGKPIIPDSLGTLNNELVAHPLPFQCSIAARFPEATAILAQTREAL